MSDTISRAALRHGDVLLYRGTGWLAKAIQLFDGTEFNHAGLYLGDGSVAEALAQGVIRQGLGPSTAGRVRVLARRLKQDVPSMQPVVSRALEIVSEGHRYAYEQLLLLAFLALTRKVRVTPVLRALMREVLDAAAGVVAGIVAAGKEPMICSEFVYRCYEEALPDAGDLYTLEINRFPRGALPRVRGLAASPRERGRGLHPDSLLAWRLSSPAIAWRSPLRGRPPVAATPPGEEDVERLIEQYFGELRGAPRRAAPAARVSDGELQASIDRFAASFQSRGATRMPEAAAREVAVRSLASVVPDFVTPGDLKQCENLFDVGDLDLAPPTPAKRSGARRRPSKRPARHR